MKKKIYTREEVVLIVDSMLQASDQVIDYLVNEDSDHSIESLIEMGEEDLLIVESPQLTAGCIVAITERERQFSLGYDYNNDELYANNQLADAGAVYALSKRELWWGNDFVSIVNRFWPWELRYWKPTPDDRIKELGKAAALIIAQIDYYLNKKSNG